MRGKHGGMAELVDAKVCDYRENVVLSFPIWNFSNSCGFESRYHHQQQITIMDFGNDIPDYDPDDFDNYDYE